MLSDTQRQDQEQTHPTNNEGGAFFQKVTEKRLNLYGHVMRKDDEHNILRKLLRTDIPAKRIEDDPTKTERRMSSILNTVVD